MHGNTQVNFYKNMDSLLLSSRTIKKMMLGLKIRMMYFPSLQISRLLLITVYCLKKIRQQSAPEFCSVLFD